MTIGLDPRRVLALLMILLPALPGCAESADGLFRPTAAKTATQPADQTDYIRARYTKSIHCIPMRDGVKLFTAVYAPKDASRRAYPILMTRTPYRVRPPEPDAFPTKLGPSTLFAPERYIFVYQDVRGRYKSEGKFEHVRPQVEHKSKSTDIDESTDACDTIEYLLAHVRGHNGRVGMWGISYPGFYCSTAMIDAHPALKAVSPQAPVGDWFFDDGGRYGTYVLPSIFGFLSSFETPQPTTRADGVDEPKTDDGYQFFLNMGPLKNLEDRYFRGRVEYWTQVMQHRQYDEFWEARNILPRLRKVAPAVLVVGGWFDTEDLYGTIRTYHAIEQQNPGIVNTFVMGPWRHGGWGRDKGDRLGNISFGGPTSEFYQRNIELAFFNRYLKDKPEPALPEAYVFETGANKWRTFDSWPPAAAHERPLYLREQGGLAWDTTPVAPLNASDDASSDSFISDPARPVPYTETVSLGIPPEYTTDDQRFAARRPDVLVYQTEPLAKSVTFAGPITADLWVSTTAGDADWVVKVVDVFPLDAKDTPDMAPNRHLGGYQMLVRAEVVRGRFRESYAKPKPFTPNEPAEVHVPLLDVFHTFEPGHRIMVQVQSTWFPMIDRNPQKYVENLFEASEADFTKAVHRVYRDREHTTKLRINVLD